MADILHPPVMPSCKAELAGYMLVFENFDKHMICPYFCASSSSLQSSTLIYENHLSPKFQLFMSSEEEEGLLSALRQSVFQFINRIFKFL